MSTTKKAVIFSDGKIKRFEKIVKQQTEEKKQELNRTLDNKVDEVFDKKFQQFLKEFKVKKELEDLKKASNQLEDFERQLEEKKRTLKDAVKLHSKKVETICDRQAKINGYEHRIHWGGYGIDYNDYKTKLEEICREELTKQFRKSTKEGQELDKIDNKVNNLLMTLSYPNLVAEEVDLNKALEDGSSMLSIALNPNTLKQISN